MGGLTQPAPPYIHSPKYSIDLIFFLGQTCTAAGWGLISEKGLASEELKEVRKIHIHTRLLNFFYLDFLIIFVDQASLYIGSFLQSKNCDLDLPKAHYFRLITWDRLVHIGKGLVLCVLRSPQQSWVPNLCNILYK